MWTEPLLQHVCRSPQNPLSFPWMWIQNSVQVSHGLVCCRVTHSCFYNVLHLLLNSRSVNTNEFDYWTNLTKTKVITRFSPYDSRECVMSRTAKVGPRKRVERKLQILKFAVLSRRVVLWVNIHVNISDSSYQSFYGEGTVIFLCSKSFVSISCGKRPLMFALPTVIPNQTICILCKFADGKFSHTAITEIHEKKGVHYFL